MTQFEAFDGKCFSSLKESGNVVISFGRSGKGAASRNDLDIWRCLFSIHERQMQRNGNAMHSLSHFNPVNSEPQLHSKSLSPRAKQ